jgi:two-component system phosphate regulon sensor histidine kinase PhoR
MADGLVAMDADFNITSFNPAAEAITGVKAQNAIGRKCYEVYGKATAGPDGKPICDYMCPIRHGGGRDTGVGITARDGQTRALAVTGSTLRDADGTVIGGVDMLSDVTAEIQAERMKSNFLSNISHELRTPLTPIKGFADVMRRKQVPRGQQLEYLGEIIASTDRLERIVAILVDVAAMEAGRLRVNPAAQDPASLVRQAADRWRERGVRHEIVAVASRGLPGVAADVALIPRALDELLDNAVKFSPDGGRITVRARRVPRGVEFSVTDNGIGIARRQTQTLFDEFVQADPTETRAYGGLGVGLAFVRRVVEAHGGRLGVRSRPGRGSTFSFVLRPFTARTASRTARAAKRPSRRRAGSG